MANDIVWTSSDETGAPQLTNAAGSLDALLHAVLVTGWRVQTLTSLSVSGGVATATLAGHGYSDQRMVDIAGATPSQLNGRKLITVTGSGTFTFDATGVANGAATGSITAKRSGLGWTRPHNSGNVSIYARSDPAATAMGLRINDSGASGASATAARALMVWDWSDLNTYTHQAPKEAQYSGGLYWPKGPNTAAAKPWVAVGDGRTVYLFSDQASYPASSYGGMPGGLLAFGDIASDRAGDAYACMLAGTTDAGQVDSSALGFVSSVSGTPSGPVWLARPFSGLGDPVKVGLLGLRNGGRCGGNGQLFPSPVDNGVRLQGAMPIAEANATFLNPIRGLARGLADPLAGLAQGAMHLALLPNVTGSTRDWLLVGFQQQGNPGHVAFDVTGPWD